MSTSQFVTIFSPPPIAGDPLVSTPIRYDMFVKQLFKADSFPMMASHAALGICGEAGELADAIKKHVHYGQTPNHTNIIEELGDCFFYLHAVMNLYGMNEQHVLQQNATKLAQRYKDLTWDPELARARLDKKEPPKESTLDSPSGH